MQILTEPKPAPTPTPISPFEVGNEMSEQIDGNDSLEEVASAVAAEGGIEGPDDARRVVQSVLWGLERYLPADAYGVLVSSLRLPDRDRSTPLDAEDRSIARFFEELADREEIEIERAAVHARVVAEVLRARMSSPDIDALSALVPGDFLALFERDGRGQLTQSEGTTQGVKEVHHPDAERHDPAASEGTSGVSPDSDEATL